MIQEVRIKICTVLFFVFCCFQETSHYEDPDALPELEGELTITVGNPEKVGDGMGAYLVYPITTKVSCTYVRMCVCSVHLSVVYCRDT